MWNIFPGSTIFRNNVTEVEFLDDAPAPTDGEPNNGSSDDKLGDEEEGDKGGAGRFRISSSNVFDWFFLQQTANTPFPSSLYFGVWQTSQAARILQG